MAKKKSQSKGLIIAFVVLIVLPSIAFIGWYGVTAGLQSSGSSMSAEEAMANEFKKAQEALRAKIVERANEEGFQVDSFDACDAIEDQYRLPSGYVFTDFTRRQLVGLKPTATEEQVRERCVIFAKVVARMQKLAHHDRYVFVCEGAEFKTDEAGKYRLIADENGKGVIEVKAGLRKLVPIRRHSHILIGTWQVYNLGDGCVVIGMSKSGTFSFSGSVSIDN